jgi:hypothetical protein
MSKILDKDFRSELYKNLQEAGYSKGEATDIVSVKYYEALKINLVDKLRGQADSIEHGKEEVLLSADEYSTILSEWAKLKEYFAKNAKKS